MKSTTGLALAAVGAILAFAVHGHPHYVNFNAIGWVLILVGVAGLLMPPGTQRRLRQRLTMRDGRVVADVEDTEVEYDHGLVQASRSLKDGEIVSAADVAAGEYVVQR
jgi:hypothetical protein